MKHKLTILAGCLSLLLQPMLCPAAGFLKLPDVEGESADTRHKDWIVIESMATPIHRSGSEVLFGDITIVKQLDKSSRKLAEAVANGTRLSEATIEFTKLIGDSQEVYLQYKMADVFVTSYTYSSDPPTDLTNDRQVDEFSFNFEVIKFRYGGIRQTVIRHDENGNEIERVTVGVPARLGGVIPPEDDVPSGGSHFDSISISENKAEAVEQSVESQIAG